MTKSSNLTFLDAAEIVLREHGGELTAHDIVRLALERGDLRTQGATPETAMRARLAVDIVQQGSKSRFQRIGPNRFVLREWQRDEYDEGERSGKGERVACVAHTHLGRLERTFGFVDHFESALRLVGTPDHLTFLDRPLAESSDDYKQLIAYVMLKDRSGLVLTYQRGAYSTSSRFLQGSQCLGFGGHVTEDDAHSLFGRADGGVLECARREIAEELRGLRIDELEIVGLITDNSSPNGLRHLAIVLRGTLPVEFTVPSQRREAGINQLRLMSPEDLWRRFDTFEFWSQILVRRFFPRPTAFPGVILRDRGRKRSFGFLESSDKIQPGAEPIMIVGEIAAGKTVAAAYLAETFNMHTVSTRQCVARLCGAGDFGTKNRADFQARAADLVRTPAGINKLVGAIAAEVETVGRAKVLVDGIRQIDTLTGLQRKFPRMRVLFVDAPRDRAYEFFCSRTKRPPSPAALAEFREARAHPVEREVPLLRYRANATLFNNGTLPELYAALDGWWRRTSNPQA